MTLIIIISFNLLPPDTVWTRCYGGTDNDEGRRIILLADGGYAIAGRTRSYGSGESDVYVIRVDQQGDTIWTRTFGTPYNDGGSSLAATADSCVMVAYTSAYETGNPDINLVKINESGDTVFTKRIGSLSQEGCNAIEPAPGQGFIITGYRSGDLYLVRISSQGDTIWTRYFGGGSTDCGHDVKTTPDGGFVAAGYTRSSGAGAADFYLAKSDSAGNLKWTRTYGGPYDDIAWSVTPTPDHGYLIAGETWSFGTGTPAYPNVYLVKTDSAGDTLWSRCYGGLLGEGAFSAALAQPDLCVICGYAESWGAGNSDLWMLKIDPAGDTVWTTTLGGAGYDKGASVIRMPAGGFTCAGSTGSFGAGGTDVWLLSFKPDTLALQEGGQAPDRIPAFIVYPDPSAGSFVIKVPASALPENTGGRLSIHDRAGRLVRRLIMKRQSSGELAVTWNGTDGRGNTVEAGVYFLSIGVLTRPVILIK